MLRSMLIVSLTKKRVEALMEETQDAHYKLETTPASTDEYVTFLTFLDDISVRVRLLSLLSSY